MSNTYAKRARQRGLLGGPVSIELTDNAIKKNALNSLTHTGLDLVVGGIAGSYVGSLMGKHGLWAGALATMGSYFFLGSRLGASFGVGIMASGFVDVVHPTVNGLGNLSTKELIKQRSKLYFQGLKSRLFLDKLGKKDNPATTTTENGTNGLGNVRYFVYPEDDQVRGPGGLDMSALDKIQSQVEQSGRDYQSQVNGTLAGSLGELAEERIY